MYPGVTPGSLVLTNSLGGYKSGLDLNDHVFGSVVGSTLVSALCARARLRKPRLKAKEVAEDNMVIAT